MNLRGVRESGTFFAIPTYGFMVGDHRHGGRAALIRCARRRPAGRRERRASPVQAPGYAAHHQVALVFLLARAFSSGCAALTGVEAITNGVPAFRKPKSKNAATTLLLLGTHRGHDAAQHHRAGQQDGT